MYRYRKTTGVSRDVLEKFKKHRGRLGEIIRIVAKRFKSRRKGFTIPVAFEVVMVYGTTGTARFDGCCWGYSGQGPRAVYELLLACGIPSPLAENAAYRSERRDASGVDWEINGWLEDVYGFVFTEPSTKQDLADRLAQSAVGQSVAGAAVDPWSAK